MAKGAVEAAKAKAIADAKALLEAEGQTSDVKTETKMSHLAFFKKAIPVLRERNRVANLEKQKKVVEHNRAHPNDLQQPIVIKDYKGIHSVFSGFNSAFKEYFGTEAKDATTELQESGDIIVIPAQRGVMLYLPSDAPERVDNTGKRMLDIILEG